MTAEKPIPGHPYHHLTDTQLWVLIKDAGRVADEARAKNWPKTEIRAIDEALEAHQVLAYRSHGGRRDGDE